MSEFVIDLLLLALPFPTLVVFSFVNDNRKLKSKRKNRKAIANGANSNHNKIDMWPTSSLIKSKGLIGI